MITCIVACSSEEDVAQVADVQEVSEPSTCLVDWHHSSLRVPDPSASFTKRCVIGTFSYLDLDEEPGCYADKLDVQYFKAGAFDPFAIAKQNGSNRTYRLLEPETGNTIMYAAHLIKGVGDDPLFAVYTSYNVDGQETDTRYDDLSLVNDGAVTHMLPSYFNYHTFVSEGGMDDDIDGLWDGCTRTIWRSSIDPIEFPVADDIPNDGRCVMEVVHLNEDGAEAFHGTYSQKLLPAAWFSSKATTYTRAGLKSTVRVIGQSEGGLFTSFEVYQYDEQDRLISYTRDVDDDGVFEAKRTSVWSGSVVHTVSEGSAGVHQSIVEFDDQGRRIRIEDEFDSKDRPTERLLIAYDTYGNTVSRKHFDSTVVEGGKRMFFPLPFKVSEKEYDAEGRLLHEREFTDPDQAVSAYVYEPNDMVITYAYHPLSDSFESGKLKEVRRENHAKKSGWYQNKEVYLYHCSE